jgi:thiol-disulfide isomerase/thioredoxin
MPGFDGATAWLNSARLTAADLRGPGKVVLVNFWTYTCINWLRQLPHVRGWSGKYKDMGLVVVGVHTPEFSFEHDLENVRRAVEAMRIAYPVVIDNDYAVWNAFANHYWPALYFVDARGRIRHHHFGEGAYPQSEGVIRQLLNEAGATDLGPELASVESSGVEVAADWDNLRSPENYLGLARIDNFASPGGPIQSNARVYTAPSQMKLNQWAVAGAWTFRE